jgi:hypothetical protein
MTESRQVYNEVIEVIVFFKNNKHVLWEAIVTFVDICEIVVHHCLNFLFMILT